MGKKEEEEEVDDEKEEFNDRHVRLGDKED